MSNGRALILVLVVVLPMVAGCALSPQERQEIVDASAEIAAERAGTWALVRAREAGVNAEDAEKVAKYAREEARRAASEAANRLTPRAEEGKRSKMGAFLGALAVALVQVLAGAGRKMWA